MKKKDCWREPPRSVSRFGPPRPELGDDAAKPATSGRLGGKRLAGLLLAASFLGALGAHQATAEPLTLRLTDAIGEPGGRIAVIVRTYASRGISQGQICFRAFSTAPGFKAQTPSPLAMLESVRVFSALEDAVSTSTFEEGLQMTILDFASPSGSINQSDGPLAVLYFHLDPSLSPGSEFQLEIDLENTALFDAADQPVALDPRGGQLLIRAPGDPHLLEAEGDRITPGATAELGIDTLEPFPITSGQIGLQWDPSIAAGTPTVVMDPRHGNASYTVDTSTPGLVVVAFESLDASLNEVPGQIVSVFLPTAAGAAPGSTTPLTLDPSLTFLFADSGANPIDLAPGQLEFGVTAVLFDDGFELGNLSAWSTSP